VLDLAAFESTGPVPPSFANQRAAYAGLPSAAPGPTAPDLDRFFKPAGFGVLSADVTRTEHPRSGVTVLRDRWNVPHVYGRTRADAEFGAGYVSAEDRLFQMDVLRHLARGTVSGFAGPGKNDTRSP
jgi:acyl-homoserine lactone acylase PvdQ